MTIAIRFPAKEHIVGDGLTGSVVEVPLSTVPSGRQRVYDRVAFRDDTTAASKVSILVRGLADDYNQSEENTITVNLVYWDTFPIHVTEGEYIVVSFTGSATGDALDVWGSYVEGPLGECL